MKGKVLVGGIGNIFLGDDAFGVEVVKRLAQRPFLDGVTIKDFGIRSYDLAYALMDDWDLVILVDALPRGGHAGTLYIFEPELPSNADLSSAFDGHSMNPVSVLQLVKALGGQVGRLIVVGCEPATIEPDQNGNMRLSAPVHNALDEAVRVLEELIIRTRSHAKAA